MREEKERRREGEKERRREGEKERRREGEEKKAIKKNETEKGERECKVIESVKTRKICGTRERVKTDSE
jgi:hypothetical protein